MMEVIPLKDQNGRTRYWAEDRALKCSACGRIPAIVGLTETEARDNFRRWLPLTHCQHGEDL
jgi:hypothetical protein